MKSTEHRDACFRSRPFDSRLEDPEISSVDLAVPQIGVSLRYPGKMWRGFFLFILLFYCKIRTRSNFPENPFAYSKSQNILLLYTNEEREIKRGTVNKRLGVLHIYSAKKSFFSL